MLSVTEYEKIGTDKYSVIIAAPLEPPIAAGNVAIGGASVQYAVFNERTAFVELHAQEATCIAFGTNPTAVTTARRMAAGETRFYAVPVNKAFRLAAIAGV